MSTMSSNGSSAAAARPGKLGRFRRTLRAGWAIFRIEVISGFQYRLASLGSAAIASFWALIECIVITVFYTYAEHYTAGVEAGLPLPQAITYLWVGQILFSLQAGGIDGGIHEMITKGDVGVELCRPLDLHTHWFMKLGAKRVAPFFLRGIPVLTVGLLMPAHFRVGPPASAGALLAFAMACCGALLLSSSFSALGHALLLDLKWGTGPIHSMFLLSSVLAGGYLPLQLWPDALQPFLRLQPFAGMLDLPVRLYLGLTPLSQLPEALALQLGWVAVFILLGRWLIARNLKRLVVQGG